MPTGQIKFYTIGIQSTTPDNSPLPGSPDYTNHQYVGNSFAITTSTLGFQIGAQERYSRVLIDEEIYYQVYLKNMPEPPKLDALGTTIFIYNVCAFFCESMVFLINIFI